ncbi:MAG: hypothetical protein DRP10_02990 [Candidatus Aenigmatarchaeota archaeon]|nr:MAG: hypothetical protein DRP10_02990 [Candidatus Aenigmarchaeota archaeon]
MNYIIFIGLIAGALTTISLLPQIIKTLKLKETRDISLLWCITIFTGIFLWVIYGLLINDAPLIVSNSISLILVSILLCLKLKFG